MKHLGDITLIKGNEAPVVDCVIGGSPCQDLSLAGKRAGLAGARSGLYMEQIRIIKEMRANDRGNGRTGVDVRPRYMVWENVPGAFSTNGGKDFAAVLEEAIRVAEPEAPNVDVPEKGWPTAGCFFDEMGKWSVAWRVMDAQYWGVPQRRRRICLVCDFNGLNAPKIVFGEAEHHGSTECAGRDSSVGHSGAKPRSEVQPVTQGLSGHPDESQPQGKEAAGNAGESTGGAVGCDLYNGAVSGDKAVTLNTNTNATGAGPTVAIPYTLKIRGGIEGGGKGALVQTDKSATLSTLQDQTLFQPVTYGIGSYHSNAMKSDNPHSGIYEAETSRTLDALNCGYPGCNQGGMAVVQPVTYDARGNGDGLKCATLTGDHQNRVTDYTSIVLESVVTDLVLDDQGGQQINIRTDGKSPTLRAEMHGNIPAVMETYQKVTGPLMANSHPGSYTGQDAYSDMLVAGVDCRNATEYPEMNATLQSDAAHNLNSNNVVRVKHIVRRMTPLECELLQGFPKNWTNIGEWVDSKGKKHKEADSPRYKALGNSIALPPWKWVLKRLCACYERDATMASLFDGIGGFPLIWEQLNGKGSCLWASEIEEFPMAVTKLRFGG